MNDLKGNYFKENTVKWGAKGWICDVKGLLHSVAIMKTLSPLTPHFTALEINSIKSCADF